MKKKWMLSFIFAVAVKVVLTSSADDRKKLKNYQLPSKTFSLEPVKETLQS